MAIRIGSNIASLSAQRRLNEATTKTSTAFERLASGQRLNRPSDDPAGLAVASALRVSSRVFTQATRNINDGISYLSIAEGALTELKGIIIRARELATQASNGTFSTTQRASLDNELQALGQEYNRIIDTTSFNGTAIFDSTNENLTLQAGFGTGGILTAAISSDRADTLVASRNVSVTADGTQGNSHSTEQPNYSSRVMSPDGRFVLFNSVATNLVSGDSNGNSDVFLKDLQTGTLTLVSSDSNGTIGNGSSNASSISTDGRYVLFGSSSSNLVAGDTNGVDDLFLKDLWTGVTTRVTTAADGTQSNGAIGSGMAMSADGRYVAFTSSATNLVAGDSNGSNDVFVKDVVTGTIVAASTTTGGTTLGNNHSGGASISNDGRYVSFTTSATNFAAGDSNGRTDIYVKDLVTGTTQLVSSNSSGTIGNADSNYSSFSADGRYVLFGSYSSNFGTGDANAENDVFMKDLQTGTLRALSTTSSGAFGDSYAGIAPMTISADNRYVTFYSNSTNLVAGDTNLSPDAFVKDTITGEIRRMTDPNGGQLTIGAGRSSISSDGRYISFYSGSTNVAGSDTNGSLDIFVVANPFITASSISRFQWVSIKSQETAKDAQTWLDQYLTEINSVQGVIGASQSRFAVATNVLVAQSENYLSAAGRITDADIAYESAALVGSQITQQAAASVLAQANQQPELVLMLLRN